MRFRTAECESKQSFSFYAKGLIKTKGANPYMKKYNYFLLIVTEYSVNIDLLCKLLLYTLWNKQ